jgi:hypothetical protein
MPRDSNGIYTLPASNPVVPETIIATGWANPTLEDIGAELTNSLPRSGSAPMTGPVLLPNGTLVAPAAAFSAATSTGMFRDPSVPGNPGLGFALGGVLKLIHYAAKSVMDKLLMTPGIMADTGIIIYVDPDTGTTAPADPIAGDPFVDLNYAMDWLVKFRQSHQAKTTIFITEGKTVQYNASRVVRYNVVIRSTGPGIATINGNNTTITFMSASDADLTDLVLTNLKVISDGCNVGLNNTASNQASNASVSYHAINGGGFTSDGLAVQPRGSILLENGFFNVTTGGVTLTAGTITVDKGSNFTVVGDLNLPAGYLAISNGSNGAVGGSITATNAEAACLSAIENSSFRVDGNTTLNTTAVTHCVTASGNSTIRIGQSTNNVSITSAVANAVLAQRNATIFFGGSAGSIALSGATACVSAQTRSQVQFNGGKTPFTIPGASKAFSAITGAYILMVSQPTAGTPVYTPALNAASGTPSTGSYITT